jgi:hypothetical protein
MTQKSFDDAGKKRDFEIVGTVAEEPKAKSVVQQEMDRLRAEQAEKEKQPVQQPVATESEEPKKRGPKPKKQAE